MKCPYCGADNISGIDDCESCHGDLSSLDGVVPSSAIERVLMEDPISKMRPRESICVKPHESILDAVRKMNQGKVGCALVCEGDETVGILTEWDIVYRVLAKKKRPKDVKVAEAMTPNPVTLDEDDSLAYALNRMAVGGYRHVPILRNGKLAGIISVRDVLKYLGKLFPESGR